MKVDPRTENLVDQESNPIGIDFSVMLVLELDIH